MAAVLSCALLFSCNNEDFLEGNGLERTACDHICFGISPDENARTRGTAGNQEDGYTSDRFVLRSDDSADTLCVRAVVSEGIHASGFDDSRVITRGTPVTKDNFYDTFHVLAYWKKNGTLVDQFYMDEDASNKTAAGSVAVGNIWSTNNTYYWPGAEHKLQFYAWAPADIEISSPQSPSSTTFFYNVPVEVVNQQDIVVAKTDEVKGDFNQAQPLSFRHICTAVRFVVGSQMQPGTIKSVTLKNVRNKGDFDMASASDGWDLDETSTFDFTQTLNKQTEGTETDGTAITPNAGTFMMLPQRLPAGATVKVVFNDGNKDRTLTASIAGMEWPMGKTVTYKLSISPEYELEFTSVPETQDAHYEICTVNVRAADIPDGKEWELSASADDGAAVSVQLEADVNQFAKEGFWTDKVMRDGQETEESARGTASLTGQGNGEHTVYVFLPENAGKSDRTVTLSLKMKDSNTDFATCTITQKCPTANGWEQIDDNEQGDYSFNWNRKVAYIFPYNLGGWPCKYSEKEGETLIQIIITTHNAEGYTSINKYNVDLIYKRAYVLIEYAKLNSTTATDANDGYNNTLELYKKVGSAVTGEFEQALLNTYKTESGKETEHMFRLPDDSKSGEKNVPRPSGENNPQSGILNYILKKNRYCLSITETDTEVTKAPYLKETDLVWYLPAYGEFSTLPSDGSSGDYWSSTSGTGEQAYLGNGSSVERSSTHRVRAKRINH